MSISLCRFFSYLLLSIPLTVHASSVNTQASRQTQQPSSTSSTPTISQNPPKTYDQIVRLSLVEGDVRISRGKDAEHASGGDWGQATAGVPVETGFSLVTGKGRTEIEFEDASTVYLGENSVMVFNQLTATDGIPRTDVTLVSGVATLHVQPEFPGELFIFRSPVGRILVRYPDKNFLRVNSYLDAMALTPQEDAAFHFDLVTEKTAKGQTTIYKRDGQVIPATPGSPNEFADWDAWTAERIATRDSAISATMKEAGLTAPIPGLAEIKDQGTFFACAPYGTCWEPTGGWNQQKATQLIEAQETAAPSRQQSSPYIVSVKDLQSGSSSPILRTEYEAPFPCSPNQIRRVIARDPVTGKERVIRTEINQMQSPYYWAVCHTGSWIHHGQGYAWVAGTKRHHICPVHWVKYGGTKGYVPIHPHDIAGKPPINIKHGVFETTGRRGESVQHVAFNANTSVKLLDGAPKEFLRPYFPTLQHAETPHLEAHLVKDSIAGGKPGSDRATGTPINFDHRSQSFQLARQVTLGGKNTMVTEHFGGNREAWSGARGGSSGRFGGDSSGGGSPSHMSNGGGSFHGGSGAFSGGGASHGGGGGFGGGGGSHGGGGGFSGGGGGGAASGGGSHK